MISNIDMPRLKPFELVSSISTKFDDYFQKNKSHKDFAKPSAVQEDVEKLEFKRDVKNPDLIDKVSGFYADEKSCTNINLPKSIKRNSIQPISSSSSQRISLSLLKEELGINDEFELSKCEDKELNAIGTYKSRGVKGVKEDCERFRLQMKILKEKANDSRIREVMVEGLVENLHKNVNETKNNTFERENENSIVEEAMPKMKYMSRKLLKSTNDTPEEKRILINNGEVEIDDLSEQDAFLSFRTNKNSSSSYKSTFDGNNNRLNNAHEDFKARKRIKTYINVPSCSNTSESSTSSSCVSSLSSLPLSHYVQKLKCFAPVSRCPSHSSVCIKRNVIKENNGSNDRESFVDIRSSDYKAQLQDLQTSNQVLAKNCEEQMNQSDEDNYIKEVDMNKISTINDRNLEFGVLTTNPTSTLQSGNNTHLGMYACQRARKSTPTLKKNCSGDKINKKVGNILVTKVVSSKENKVLDKNLINVFHPTQDYYQQSKFQTDDVALNELKGLLESFILQVDAKNETIKKCYEDLEKQWNYSKDELFKEILEARDILQNDIKVKLEEIMKSLITKSNDNDDHILSLVEKRFERHQLQSDIGILALKSEMKHLWNEVRDLSQKNENIHTHIKDFIHTIEKSKGNVTNEQIVLKNENNPVVKELQINKQYDMETQITNFQKLVEKVQDNNLELERTQNLAHVESKKEKMLIMERVESLSKLYLGGLEEIRSNVSNIKINCRDRVDELEGQWAEFKYHQEYHGAQHHSKQTEEILMKKIESIHTEVADFVKSEQIHLQETLERENMSIQHQLMIMCAANKHEILNLTKTELNKRLQFAQNKVLLMTNALKQELENLQCEVRESQEGAEGLLKATCIIAKKSEVASRAANEVTTYAAKAKDMLNDMQTSFSNEITSAQQSCFQLQEQLKLGKNVVQSVVSEAFRTREELAQEKERLWIVASTTRAKTLELNELIHKESLNIVETMVVIKNDRNIASHAAEEARCSAIKANEVFCEISNYVQDEMAKVQHMSIQLQEKIEKEKQKIEEKFEVTLQHNHESQERCSQELDLAMKTWKCAMNAEIAKAMEVTLGLEEEQQRASMALEHVTMLYPQRDQIQADIEEYISKTQCALDDVVQSIHQMQANQEDISQSMLLKKQELDQFKNSCQTKLSQLQKMVRVLEKRLKVSTCEQNVVEKRIEMVENVQVNLGQSYEYIRNITTDLEKTATIWLPKYEVAARIVNELSSKMNCMDEKVQLICGGESFMQQILHVVELKINELKDMVFNSLINNMDAEIKQFLERIDSREDSNCHAIAILADRVRVLENSSSHDSNMFLKSECITKCNKDGCKSKNMPMDGNSNEIIDILQRQVESVTTSINKLVTSNPNEEFGSKIVGLESRIEHVALATFANLRLLDKKIVHVTAAIQSALDGATMADKKCVALGFELVKVFRMFSCKQGNKCHKSNENLTEECKDFSKDLKLCNSLFNIDKKSNLQQDVTCQNQLKYEKSSKDHQNTSRIFENLKFTSLGGKMDISPNKHNKKEISPSITQPLPSNAIKSLEAQHPSTIYEAKQESSNLCGFGERENFANNRGNSFYKLHGSLKNSEEDKTSCEPNLDGHFIIEKCQEGFVKKCQRTNIRLEAGRIHVNVSHRSRGLNQLHKKNDLIGVQS